MYWELLFDPENSVDEEAGLESVDLYKGKVRFFDISFEEDSDPYTKEVSVIRRNYQDRSDFCFDFVSTGLIRQFRHDHYSFNVKLRQKTGDLMIGAYKRILVCHNSNSKIDYVDITECQLDCREGKLKISGMWHEHGQNYQMVLNGISMMKPIT